MQLGMIGLGRKGGNMVRRLMRAGHECVVFHLNAELVSVLATEGAVVSTITVLRTVTEMVREPMLLAAS